MDLSTLSRTRASLIIAGASAVIFAVIATSSGARPGDARSTDRGVAGTPPYEWNQPFLDWPQTGDLACDEEFGKCGGAEPSIRPADISTGVPLKVDRLVIKVGDRGRHEQTIGELVLPDGIHTRTFFRIANADEKQFRVWQTHVEFRSLDGGPKFEEFARDRGPFDGAERVEAVLVWNVDWAAEDATMEIADLVVE
jgi:hypothetical protein